MTLEEFGHCTPGMFMALMKRQNVKFRHDCYLAGITASIIANVNRGSKDDKLWSPFDFVPNRELEKKRDRLKREIFTVFGAMMEFNSTPEAMDSAREKIIERLSKEHEDVEELFAEVFPHWEKRKLNV
jgi:hypothetical protein